MNAPRTKVLIVDDESSIRRALRTTFGTLGYDISEAVTGEQALPLLNASSFDAVLLDINMPGMGGIHACREIRRQFPRVPLLMLSVRDDENDKVEALEAGADDNVTKPFPIRELVARVRAAVRRSHTPAGNGNAIIAIGEITLDPARRLVQKNGETVHLTPKEFDLLHHLMKHAGLPVMHGRLLSAVWGPKYGGELEYLRAFVRQLRMKLEDDAGRPKYLLTDSHVGYRFREAPSRPLCLPYVSNFILMRVTRHSLIERPPGARSPGSILIVDDDASVRRALHITLQTLGFTTSEAASGEEALLVASASPYEVVLLDVNLLGLDGLETCRQLRRLLPRVAILMLTVRDSEDDKVQALEAGADDYVTKPFHIRELTARVRAAVRRVHALDDDANAIIRIGDIELDPARREVHKAGNLIHLTPKEFDLLHYLMAHAGLPVTHGRLLNAVWGPEYGLEVEYLRTFIRQLRKKLEDAPANPKYLLTDIQIGYRFWEGHSAAQR